MFKWSNFVNFFYKDRRKYFENLIVKKKLHHAYLFVGHIDLGLYRFSKEIILNILLDFVKDFENKEILEQYQHGLYPDLYILERMVDEKTKKINKNISIQQVRELINSLSQKAFLNSPRFVIIKEVDRLNVDSANALLKILEEPPSNTYFFLLTENIQNVLLTIQSRCQKLQFYPIDKYKIKGYLMQEYKLNEEKAMSIASLSAGLVEKAIFYVENTESLEEYIDFVDKILLFFQNTLAENFNLLKDLVPKKLDYNNQKNKADEVLQLLEIVIRDMLFLKKGLGNLMYLYFRKDELERLANKYTVQELEFFLDLLNDIRVSLNMNNLNIYLSLENLIQFFNK